MQQQQQAPGSTIPPRAERLHFSKSKDKPDTFDHTKYLNWKLQQRKKLVHADHLGRTQNLQHQIAMIPTNRNSLEHSLAHIFMGPETQVIKLDQISSDRDNIFMFTESSSEF